MEAIHMYISYIQNILNEFLIFLSNSIHLKTYVTLRLTINLTIQNIW